MLLAGHHVRRVGRAHWVGVDVVDRVTDDRPTMALVFIDKTKLIIMARQPQTMKMMSAANRQSPVINKEICN